MGGMRSAGPEGLRTSPAAMDAGTMARSPMPRPGSVGLKGGGRGKEAGEVFVTEGVSNDEQEQFRMWMQAAQQDTYRSLSDVPAFPLGPEVEGYFESLRSAEWFASLEKYRWYALNFYVHVANTGSGQDDVRWPGGSCDDWDDIRSRRLHQRRRIIDCEGYAFIARTVLSRAGWVSPGYSVAYGRPPGQTTGGYDYHIAAVLTRDNNTRFIGSQRIDAALMSQEAARGMPPGTVIRVLDGPFTTQAEAVAAVQTHADRELEEQE